MGALPRHARTQAERVALSTKAGAAVIVAA
jgi:hypothetical protein